MLMTTMQNQDLPATQIGVNTRSYKTDGNGCCTVHPSDVAGLIASGFEAIGTVKAADKHEVRFPQTKEEFLDMALAIGLTAKDLRAHADVLDPPVLIAPTILQELPEPVTTFVAPPPANQEKMIDVPPDQPEEGTEVEVAPAESEEDDASEVTISLSKSTKRELLDLAIQMGLPVKQSMRKEAIFNALIEAKG